MNAPATTSHDDLYAALTAAGHNVWIWRDDPSQLRGYADAIGFEMPAPRGPLGAPAVTMAVHYPDMDDPAIVGLYTAADQYPTKLTVDDSPICETCETNVGVWPHGFIPFVAEPVMTGIALCVPCFASSGVEAHTTEAQ